MVFFFQLASFGEDRILKAAVFGRIQCCPSGFGDPFESEEGFAHRVGGGFLLEF